MHPDASKAEQPVFIRTQLAFAANIRDPEGTTAPADVEERRMAIYRELFYNNVEGFISSGFPVLRSLYDDARWHAMVRDFFIQHRCQTPYFLEISQEFLEYLHNERAANAGDPAFLLELAHYEWVELALSVAEGSLTVAGVDPNGDLLEGLPVLSELSWPLSYRFPVHAISPDFQPHQAGEQPSHLIVYRDREDAVHFLEANPVTARLLALLAEGTVASGRAALVQIAEELQHHNPEAVIEGGRELLNDLRRRDILLGTR